MKKFARQVLKMVEGIPVCIAVISGTDEDEILRYASERWGKVHLFPCHPEMTVEQANKPILNEKMRNYGGV